MKPFFSALALVSASCLLWGCASNWQVVQDDQSKKVLVGVERAESKMLQTAISEAELVARQRIAT